MSVIFHLDLDSYFVSAQRTVDPRLKGKPVVIVNDVRRPVIFATSYEAKAKGIRVSQHFHKAVELEPNLIGVRPNYPLYAMLSNKLFEMLSKRYTTKLEIGSIDECYIDVTDIWSKYGSPHALAKEMQDVIMQELKLPASIGVADNKFVAKMSTSINKPFGITITKPGTFLSQFGSWPVIKMHGVGARTAKKLSDLNIKTIDDLAKGNPDELKAIFGIVGPMLIDHANGHGSNEIDSSHNEIKGLSNEATFDKDKSNRNEIIEVLSHIVSTIASRAKNRNIVGSVVVVYYRGEGGWGIGRSSKQTTLKTPTNDYDTIMKHVTELFDELWTHETIRLIGARLGHLKSIFDTTYQSSLFENEKEELPVQKIIKQVNHSLKTKALITGKEGALAANRNNGFSRHLKDDKVSKYFTKEKHPK